ncbi:VOC family protein [Salisediminibacterium beveridgei]|uniref:Glyoxalase/Bleomycin Resistance Protein/Dioxygenase n=1 Tax=Salisediminibacterium beveridgei TaxID=632773 RepID=A0A1D7QZK7_9BACI|nr:VOC family protein [Salisediminibacterium beveridgei]AOM84451.1 Glyoxalase/Bleomycin Resistance Protein/Dioxygenase [Salisediminibacterium beveridgei]
MISKLGQVMLYVNDQDAAVSFWVDKTGFSIIDEAQNPDEMKWVEIAPTSDAETSIILHDKKAVAKMSPDVNLGTPSLMFFTDDLDRLYENFQAKQITVGEVVTLPQGRVFNFSDHEENYFAVMEQNK